MATITVAAGGGNWATGGTWIGGVVPTASDDVLLTGTPNVTINASAFCRSIDCTGYTGTLTHNAGITLTIGTSTAGPGNVACIFSTTMTYTAGATLSTSVLFSSTVASTVQTIDFGGKTAAGSITITAATTSGYQLVNNSMNCTSTTIVTVTQGSFDTNNINCTWGSLVSNGVLQRSLIFGTSTLNVGGITIAVFAPTSNITVSAASSIVNVTGGAPGLNLGGGTTWGTIIMNNLGVTTLTASGGGVTIQNFTRTRPAGVGDAGLQVNTNFTITGTVTLAGYSEVERLYVFGQIFIRRAFAMGASSTIITSNTDYSDFQFTGTGIPATGTSLGDMGNNANITFDAPVTQYWVGNGGNWSDTAHWSTTSGGAANGRVPLPQDPVIADANSFTTTGQTMTMNMSRAGASWNFSGINRAVNWTTNNSANIIVCGSVTMASLMNRVTGSGIIVLGGRGSHAVTMAGNTFQGCMVNCGAGVYTLQDTFSLGANLLTIAAGTFNTNGMTVTALSLVMTNVNNQKTITLGASTVNLTGNNVNPVWNVVTTLTTINAGTSTIVIGYVGTIGSYTRTFTGGGFTYNNLTFTLAGLPCQLAITGANTFNALNIGPGRQLTMPVSTTNTFSVFNAVGTNYGYLYLPGLINNYASTPNAAALSITGDIDLQCKVALDNWGGAAQAFIVKEATTSARSYRFEIGSQLVDRLTLILSADGTTQSVANSSVVTGLAVGVLKWVRVTWRQSDGRVQFFTSDDGSNWTQLGTDQTIAIASIFVTTSLVEFGTRNTGASFPLAGKMYRAIIKNGINGTTVLDADFSAKPFGANSFTESSSNAATVTINGVLAQAGDGRVLLDSSVSGTAATVSKATGYVNDNYLTVKDSTATGGAVWYAGANSVNVSNNTGWNFSSGAANTAHFMNLFD